MKLSLILNVVTLLLIIAVIVLQLLEASAYTGSPFGMF